MQVIKDLILEKGDPVWLTQVEGTLHLYIVVWADKYDARSKTQVCKVQRCTHRYEPIDDSHRWTVLLRVTDENPGAEPCAEVIK